jgi:DNA-binding winged helix-turn-helix (wHTH) protein/TolB-like protein
VGIDLSPSKPTAAQFGLFEANLEQRVLTKAGLRIKLQEQPFQILAMLLQQPGEVITRDEIRQKLWTADTFVAFDDGLNTAIKKLRTALGDTADNPRFIETVPRRGYRFLAPVTFLAPAIQPSTTSTPGSLSDIVIAASEQSRVVIEKRSRPVAWLQGTIALLLAVAVGVVGYIYWERHSSRAAQPPPSTTVPAVIAPRPSVAVMGFRNLSRKPEAAWLSTALSEMLNTELAAGERLSLVDVEALAKESLTRVRAAIGADYVVLGSYTALSGQGKHIRLDLRLQDTHAGETIAEEAVEGSQDELFGLISDAGAHLRQRLQAGGLAAEQTVQIPHDFMLRALRSYAFLKRSRHATCC